MGKEIDPLKLTIKKSEWAKVEENKPKLEWLRNNYKLLRIDDDNKEQVRYVYQHINRPGMTITVDLNGDIKDGYIDTTDYLLESAKVEEIIRIFELEGEEQFDLLDDSDEDYYENDKYSIVFKNPDGTDSITTFEEANIENLSFSLWVINKQAKAYRDTLNFNYKDYSAERIEYMEVMKDNYYILKAYAFKKLYRENKLQFEGIHVGNDGVTEYPYVIFSGRGFHLFAKGKYLEKLKKKNSKKISKPLLKIESIDYSLRNDRQAELSRAEQVICDYLQPGMYEELWFKIEKEKKRIARDKQTGKIVIVD